MTKILTWDNKIKIKAQLLISSAFFGFGLVLEYAVI